MTDLETKVKECTLKDGTTRLVLVGSRGIYNNKEFHFDMPFEVHFNPNDSMVFLDGIVNPGRMQIERYKEAKVTRDGQEIFVLNYLDREILKLMAEYLKMYNEEIYEHALNERIEKIKKQWRKAFTPGLSQEVLNLFGKTDRLGDNEDTIRSLMQELFKAGYKPRLRTVLPRKGFEPFDHINGGSYKKYSVVEISGMILDLKFKNPVPKSEYLSQTYHKAEDLKMV